MSQSKFVPFERQHQLDSILDGKFNDTLAQTAEDLKHLSLPGHPGRRLAPINTLISFLDADLSTPELDTMSPHLWMMSTYSSSNVNPIHFQKVRGRDIVICEHPRLHLTWKPSHVFIKPLPRYLLSHDFWDRFLVSDESPLGKSREQLFRAAKGFLRTYFHLIKHESDFDQAKDARLLPSNITWEDFSTFISSAQSIRDSDVPPRYHYGEIRLKRLNFYSMFFLRRFQYEWGQPQYGSYFHRFYSHVLFAFALMSLLLNALQVGLAADARADSEWDALWRFSRPFSLICAILLSLTGISFGVLFSALFVMEWQFAIVAMRRKRRSAC